MIRGIAPVAVFTNYKNILLLLQITYLNHVVRPDGRRINNYHANPAPATAPTAANAAADWSDDEH